MKQKGLRKLVSMILAVVMVLSMSATAFAADITITGAKSGHTYTAYQIFSGTLYNGILSDIVWGDDVDGEALLSALQNDSTIGSDFTDVTTAQGVAEVLADYDEDDDSEKLIAFAAIVAECLKESATGTDSVYSSSNYKISDLTDGYYLVVDVAASDDELEDGDAYSRYILKVAGSDVTVATKTEGTTIEKEADDESVEVGQTVTYTLTSTVPDTTGYSTYTWKVSDTMSSGLTFDGVSSVIVKFGDSTINVSSYLTEETNGFTLTLDMTDYQAYKGQAITITYTATVNENAVAVVSTNTATLEYSNNPNDSESTEEITDDEEVYSAKIVVDKYDGSSEEKLSGATFVLYKYDTDGTTKLYYQYTEDNEETTDVDESKVEWVSDINSATEVTTDTSGAASFIGLEDGKYYLHETAAPDGYNTLSGDVEIEIDGSNATTENVSSLTKTQGVENNAGSTLPSTGGMGTTIFYIVGGVLVLGAAVLFVTKKRLGSEN